MTRAVNKDNYHFLAVTQNSALAVPRLVTLLLDRSRTCTRTMGRMDLRFAAACCADIASSRLQTQWVPFPSKNDKAKNSIQYILLICQNCLQLWFFLQITFF